MEALSPTMEEGRLVKWTKNEGDQVKAGDVLAEVETDKAIMDLVARGDGVLRKRLANEGDASPIGTLLGVIAAPDENIDAIIGGAVPATAAASAKPAQAKATPQSSDQSQTEAPAPPQQKAAGLAAAAPPAPRPGTPRFRHAGSPAGPR
jgi:pyruvate/2-oxoglutarate dehydrogenase complex dihydrolipoamide acyltransferase (E2) component